MPDYRDYKDDDFTGPGYYLVHQNTIGETLDRPVSYRHPKPGGPYQTIRELAIAERVDDYPDHGYIVWHEEGSISSVPSLNPDDLVQRDEIPVLDETPDERGWRREQIWRINLDGTGLGGDDATGVGYEARYVRPLADGTFAVITTRFYIEDLNSVHYVEPGDENYEPNSFAITEMNEYMHCTSMDDVGGTEITCDYEYEYIDRQPFAKYDDVQGWYENTCLALAKQDQRRDLHFMDDHPTKPGASSSPLL